jgi:hypothetical protein
MSTAQHTPGPWWVSRWRDRVDGSIEIRPVKPASTEPQEGGWSLGFSPICLVRGDRRLVTPEQRLANACLIAAAPDMLALIQRFERFAAGTGFSYPLGSLQELQQVIAKATGAAA